MTFELQFFFWDAKSLSNVYIIIFSLNFGVMECVVSFGYTYALSEEYKKKLKKKSAFLTTTAVP